MLVLKKHTFDLSVLDNMIYEYLTPSYKNLVFRDKKYESKFDMKELIRYDPKAMKFALLHKFYDIEDLLPLNALYGHKDNIKWLLKNFYKTQRT